MRTSTVAVLTVVALCLASRTTSAQPYATLAVGGGVNDVECIASRTCENTDVAFKLLGGYRIAPWIAGEAVYLDFGAARHAGRINVDSFGTTAFGGGVALHGNFASWTLTARLGAARVASERGVTWIVPTNVPPPSNPPSPSSLTTPKLMPYGGAALGYRFSKYVALAVGVDVARSKWERSDGASLTWNVGAVTAGVTIGR
jgi:hypothetical protein